MYFKDHQCFIFHPIIYLIFIYVCIALYSYNRRYIPIQESNFLMLTCILHNLKYTLYLPWAAVHNDPLANVYEEQPMKNVLWISNNTCAGLFIENALRSVRLFLCMIQMDNILYIICFIFVNHAPQDGLWFLLGKGPP